MKTRLSHLALLFLLLCPMGEAMAASTVNIVDKGVVFEGTPERTPEQMRGYILHAAETFRPELRAKIESDAPGALQMEFNKEDTYYLSILFTYDPTGFKTHYVSSKNLNYAQRDGVGIIHENAMVWLDEIIRKAKAFYAMQLTEKGEVTDPQAVAELHFLSTGATDNVSFRKTDETHACGKYDEVARIANVPEHEIAALPRSFVFRVAALRPVQIQMASSGFYNEEFSGNGLLNTPQVRRMRHTCGPLTFRFTPQGARKYAVEYAVSYAESYRGTCTQNVFDVTDPDKRVAVATEAPEICPR